jgi:hypothetical protein
MKKNFYQKISLLLIVIVYGLSIFAQNHKKSIFVGNWVWDKNSKQATFSIKIVHKINNEYIGSYCAVAMGGSRIDCDPIDVQSSFEFIDRGNNVVEFDFISNYSNAKGRARLKYENNQLYWEITKEPKDLFFCPQKATLLLK